MAAEVAFEAKQRVRGAAYRGQPCKKRDHDHDRGQPGGRAEYRGQPDRAEHRGNQAQGA